MWLHDPPGVFRAVLSMPPKILPRQTCVERKRCVPSPIGAATPNRLTNRLDLSVGLRFVDDGPPVGRHRKRPLARSNDVNGRDRRFEHGES